MSTERDDEQLQKHVQDELRLGLALNVSDIGVTVERGVVALEGHVSSAAQKRLVDEITRKIPGVRAIVDDLDIRPPGTPLHEVIRLAHAALDALDQKAMAGREHIQLIVHDGRVRLEGTVGSQAEKEAAEAAVGDVALGWGAVENAILVQPKATAERSGSMVANASQRDDDFDTLRIDPSPGVSQGVDTQEGHPRRGNPTSTTRSFAGGADWLAE